MNRFLKFLLFSICFSISLSACKDSASEEQKAETDKKPNIVFIMSDDHALQAISAYGHPLSKLAPTPNIDRIAEDGATFFRNYCTNSLCGPSRATILTGQFSNENGFRMNGDKFDGSQETLPKVLRENGYTTAIIGKWHLGTTPTGFDYWEILNDQGHYYNPDFIKNNDTTQVEGYTTDIITDKSIAWMEAQKSADKPFFLMVHHKAPHRNWMPPLRYANEFDSTEFPLPDSYFREFDSTQIAARDQLMTIYKDMYEGYDLKMTLEEGSPELAHDPWHNEFSRMTAEQRAAWDSAYQPKNDAMHKANLKGRALDEWMGQRFLQEYLATVKAVDDGVGKILDYLKANGMDENTLVVYTSDQGFFLGENGWFDKRYMYETSFRMPLLMKYPGHISKGQEVYALTQNLDFAETFLDYAGAPIPEEFQGKSFRPVLQGEVKDENFRDAIYYHYYDFPAFHMVKKHYGVRTDRYALMHFYDDIDQWEMYDLENDPRERNNIYNDPGYAEVRQRLHKKLDSLQEVYHVTEKEFETTSPEKVQRAYDMFSNIKGEEPGYYPRKN
ncbi:sulfatase [Zunongwangia sp. F363]|uniref:Sulfatase n=1 Tax=Autumnicola tepida TaxID=3075595 RepID=A0ABU3CA40_9FLAO|nr:sulfatase [Zunongwangia sp. F363]MDT0643077.1 sulfatase [Zunongwangia sp. F363]